MAQNQIVLSVIIPTYNRNELLSYTLSSIKKQTLDTNLFEVIVVDDGSTEVTSMVIDQYSIFFKLKYLYQEDLGYRVASARNLGINAALGDVILFVDSGIILGSNCFKEHLATHFENAANAVVIGYIFGLEVEGTEINTFKHYIDISDPDKTMNLLLTKKIYLDVREDVFTRCDSQLESLVAPWAFFWTGNVSAKSKSVIGAGFFDTAFDFNWGMEDLDLGYRLYKEGAKFFLNRNAYSIHYPHPNNVTKKLEQENCNKKKFHAKYGSSESKLMLSCNPVALNLRLPKSEKFQ